MRERFGRFPAPPEKAVQVRPDHSALGRPAGETTERGTTMVNLNQTEIKRGGFARDRRTGAVVKVAEKGGRDWMVKPAYKTDGYWTAPENLVPARDPHEWTGRRWVGFLFGLAAGAVVAWHMYNDLTGHGFGSADAVSYSAPSGVLAMWLARVLSGNHKI